MDNGTNNNSIPAPAENPEIAGNPDINFFGATNFRNQNRRFGIKTDDRRRHMYVVGKTGMGKTTILENMVLNDIYAGHGVGLVDPHGDFAEKILDFIPAKRINDVVYFNPADIDYPIGFNILETIRPEQKHLVAAGLMGVFKKIWPDVWSARMEYILNNTILALLDFPGTTLLGINRLLADDEYRRRVVANSKDPVVKAFWVNEFANYSDKFRTEAVAPIQNKIGQFLSASVIRNIVAQVKSRINIREIMDSKKIFIMNLSKGRIGEDNSRLLGGMLITKIQLAAMERVDIPERDRKDFFLYVDEFQNFATESFANILSEARKYRLDLIMAHQYMEQLEEEVMAAVIGNVGTTVTFRVGSSDAEILAKEFAPVFVEEDLVNLPKYHIYLKLMIDGVGSKPFSALTLPPIGSPTGSTEKVVRVSRERYAVPRDKIEDKIARWSGMVIAGADDAARLEVDDEDAIFDAAVVEHQKKMSAEMAAHPVTDDIDEMKDVQVSKTVIPAKPLDVNPTVAGASVTVKTTLPTNPPIVTAVTIEETPLAPATEKPAPKPAAQIPSPAPSQRDANYRHDRLPSQQKPPQLQKPPSDRLQKPQPRNEAPQLGEQDKPLSASQKKRRRRKKKSGGGDKFSESPRTGSNVVLGDPAQKGMSLNALKPLAPKAQETYDVDTDRLDIGDVPPIPKSAPVVPPELRPEHISAPVAPPMPPKLPPAEPPRQISAPQNTPKQIPPNTPIQID